VLTLYGLRSSGKIETTEAVLKARALPYVVIKCKQCLSQRHLLSKIFAACAQSVGQEDNLATYDRVDSLNSLGVNLQRLFEGRKQRVILVLDTVEDVKGASTTLLPALARLGDMVSTEPQGVPHR
jgi:origin recognition complex subunit 5